MAINFPDNPINGQTFQINNVIYEYFQTKKYWRVIKSNDVLDGGESIILSDYNLNFDSGFSDSTYDTINNIDGGFA
jgi:hypothetical protein